MGNFTFSKNIKVDFTNTVYNTNSLFDVTDDTGLYTASAVTYSQLTSTGPGLDFQIGIDSTYIEITCKSFTDPCFNTSATASVNTNLPSVVTYPINFSSTYDWGLYGVSGITQVSEKNCRDIYINTADGALGLNSIKRLKNFTNEFYTDKGPFEYLTSSYNQPDAGSDLLYLPEYDAIAYGKPPTLSPINKACMCIISMSGELLFESDPNHPSASIEAVSKFFGVVDDYLYVDGRVSGGLADVYRIHLPTMTFDYNWVTDVASNFIEPVLNFFALPSGSGFIVGEGAFTLKYDASGSIQYRLETANALGGGGGVSSMVQDSNGDFIIGGYFGVVQYRSGSVSFPFMGQFGLVKVNSDLDYRPFTSSFSRYTVNPFNLADTAGRFSWFGPRSMGIDSNDNLVVGFVGSEPINTNISGSYVDVSGSLAIFDPTGSLISDWNYPQNVRRNFEGVKYIEIPRIYIQEDDSIICIIKKSTSGTAALAEYDNLNVGPKMLISQSGVLTNY